MIHLDPCVIATTLMTMIPAILAQASGKSAPGHEDFMSALGALPATTVVLLYCKEKGRSLFITASAFLTCGALGIIMPGALLWNKWPEFAISSRWHIWAFLGFAFSIGAHFIINACLSYLDRKAPGLVKRAAQQVPFLSDPPKDPEDPIP